MTTITSLSSTSDEEEVRMESSRYAATAKQMQFCLSCKDAVAPPLPSSQPPPPPPPEDFPIENPSEIQKDADDGDCESDIPEQEWLDEDTVISFRPIRPSDRERIKALHEEWFPVVYHEDFYDDLVQNQLAGMPLQTCVAVAKRRKRRMRREPFEVGGGENFQNVDEEQGFTSSSSSNHHDEYDTDNDDVEEIAGCLVGAFISSAKLPQHLSSLLLTDATRYQRLFYIMTLGTVERYRRVGLASRLVERCMECQVLTDPSCGAVYLHVITSNEKAIGFYHKLGFDCVKEIEDYYDIDGGKYPCYLYARYFHGNRGHRDLYRYLSSALWAVWRHISALLLVDGPPSLDWDDHP